MQSFLSDETLLVGTKQGHLLVYIVKSGPTDKKFEGFLSHIYLVTLVFKSMFARKKCYDAKVFKFFFCNVEFWMILDFQKINEKTFITS